MKSMLSGILITSLVTAAQLEPSNLPPAGLDVENTPLFIVLGSDDNFGSGMPFLLDLFENRSNPIGRGQAETFDGAPARMSFYSNTLYMNGTEWMDWHKRALEDGHELGLHTDQHPHISSTEQAISEIRKNRDQFGTGIQWATDPVTFPPETFTGFRSPYLDVSNHVFNALEELGLRYDCSVEEGMAPGVEIEDFPWPYTLDNGATEGWMYLYEQPKGIRDIVESHPRIWEIPAYPVFFVPDSLYDQYNLTGDYDNGVRDQDNWNNGEINESEDARKMTGLDYDAWYVQKWSGHELAMTLLYNLKLRLSSNRVPLAFGIHSQYYNAADPVQADWLQGLQTFVDSALTYEDVRFVTANSLIDWMENPVGLDGTIGPGQTAVAQNIGGDNSIAVTATKTSLSVTGIKAFDYTIVSLAGRTIAEGTVKNGAAISLPSCSKGVYLIQMKSGVDRITRSFILP